MSNTPTEQPPAGICIGKQEYAIAMSRCCISFLSKNQSECVLDFNEFADFFELTLTTEHLPWFCKLLLTVRNFEENTLLLGMCYLKQFIFDFKICETRLLIRSLLVCISLADKILNDYPAPDRFFIEVLPGMKLDTLLRNQMFVLKCFDYNVNTNFEVVLHMKDLLYQFVDC
jgi:hypothetical protein